MVLLYLFPSDVWGTVSDWVMVGVTSLTAFYLYKTLKSQQEVQRTQNELYRIESIRFAESIKPKLNYSASTSMVKTNEEGKEILTIEVRNETESIALDISRVLSEGNKSKQVFIPKGYSDIRDHLIKGDNPMLFHFLIEPKMTFITFSIEYKDVAGSKYRQGVFCVCDSYGIEIHPYLPETF
jgi:hypothetical protein